MFRREIPNRQPERVAAIAALATLLTACVISIEPVIPASDSVYEPALIGTWVDDDGGETATIGDAGDGGYLIDYVDTEGKRGQFAGRLGWLGDRLLLEVTPVLPDAGASDGYEALILPARAQFVVAIEEGELRVQALDLDTVRDILRGDVTSTPHLADAQGSDAEIVLTGTTTELRAWLSRSLHVPGALADSGVWRRARPGG